MVWSRFGVAVWEKDNVSALHNMNKLIKITCLEEYPLLMRRRGMTFNKFRASIYPSIDHDTKAEILKLNNLAEDLKTLDTETVEKLVRKNPIKGIWREAWSDEISKIFRIKHQHPSSEKKTSMTRAGNEESNHQQKPPTQVNMRIPRNRTQEKDPPHRWDNWWWSLPPSAKRSPQEKTPLKMCTEIPARNTYTFHLNKMSDFI